MPEFELSKVPTEIVRLLLSRGTGIPPLLWTVQQNLPARKALDQKDNQGLFGTPEIRDEQMAAAVRGLLYLYTGWPAEAQQYAALAAPGEHAYIAGLCERQLGHADAAKNWFRKLGARPVSAPPFERVMQLLRTESDPAIKRFREIVEQQRAWEAFAFIDLFEAARAGRLSPAGEKLVCRLQDMEFEALFVRCFECAVGRSIAKRKVISEVDEQRREQEHKRKMAERRERMARQRKMAEARKAAGRKEEKSRNEAPPPVPKVNVLCPKCGAMVFVAEGLRGKPARCTRCTALFLVPKKKHSPDTARKTISAG
ncbi:MAG TPA: hypothetical protein VLM89_17280 [Phycisphaerae bacterium]|nr:hypothetical protein [Phycisphaerae bacterium]